MDHSTFQKLDGLPIIICKVCQHGVWPSEIVCHITGRPHRKSYAEAVQIQIAIQQWEDIAQQAEEAEIPYGVDQALAGLPIYPDGLMCCRDYSRCQYIGRTIESMRQHWRQVHGWSQNPCRGRVTREQRIQGEAELRQSYILVNCQQIFPTRKGSYYIHVRGGETEPYIPVPTDQVDEAITAVQQAVEAAQQAHAQSSSGEDIHDANPWLRVTRWTQYLQDFTTPEDFSRLRELVETPLADSDDPVEQGVRRIWEAMEGVVWKSQRTVQHTGQAIRVEAVRSEKGQISYRPLQAYMDADGVAKHVQLWQQIVAFIACTQIARGGEQEGKRPVYGMTSRQRKKWRQLWQMAQIESAGPTRAGSPDPMDEDRKREDPIQQWRMSELEQACLGFCIELLNQTYHAQEYESVLICAMAVLGRGEFGWRDPESYPPILSRVIKVARFMIVQQALWLDPNAVQIIETWQQPQRCAEWVLRSAIPDIDSAYSSDSGDSDNEPDSVRLASISPPTSPIRSQDPPSRIQWSQNPSRKTFQEQ
ncbi:hypothetical protein BDV40DRAFT_306924, partial [Aspergillus tamarii]